uniref:Helicase C-terminal domain-containing protein n=1 Tax=Aegilops tauschii TaxID=37682 RepID=R7W454_AEGTA
MRRVLRRGLGILLVPLPGPLSRPPPPPIPLAALLLLPRRLDAFSRRTFCGYSGGRAVEQFSDDEYDHEYEDHRPSSSVANIDEWRWKLSMLQRNAEEQEIISRDRRDRRDYDQIANLAKRMGLYSELYGKVIVASKVPLPNYRPDLDDKRPQREVVIPLSLQRRVEGFVQEHLDRSLLPFDKDGGKTESGSEKAEQVNLDEKQDPLLDESVMEKILQRKSLRMRNFQRSWQESPEGAKMVEFRKSLPAYKEKERLLAAIARNQVIVISGETGCGKTTQLPQFVLESEIESGRGAFCNIICTQPRRISAMAVAERVSTERGENLGESGFTHPVRAHFLEDILERTGYKMTASNQLDDYGQDKVWKTQRQLLPRKRKNQITTLVEDALQNSNFETYGSRTRDSLANWNPDCIGFNLIEAVLCHICRKERAGAVLVFMTGWDDISSLKDQLKAHPLLGDPNRVLLLACHGSMATSEQRLIFDKAPPNVRKVVLATNMAEASITINDIVFVMDCGKAKETTYDALNNTPCLLPSWISKASSRQRRGRAGRVQPGECYHLYPRCVYDAFAEYQLPELLRTPLNSLCLQIKSLQVDSIGEFLSAALQPPEPRAVQNAVEFLKMIGSLDENENLTDLGRYLSMLPVDPKLGKMLIMGAVFRCIDPILTVVAGLSARDPFLLPQDKKDHRENSMSFKTMDDGQVLVYANSVNAKYQTIPYPWLVFGEKVKVNAVFIRDSTGVSDSILILFGGAVTKGSAAGHLKMLDGYIDLFMDPSLSECYLQLKEELDKLVQKKLEDPTFDIHKEGKYILFAAQELAAGDLCEGRFVFGRETSRARLRDNEDGKSNIIKDGMNPKSLLQTLLMRAGHTPPKYKTKHLKTNEFRAMVEFKGMQFVGKPKRNKQVAERDAAIEALGWLTQTSGTKLQDEGDDSPLDLTDNMLKLLSRPRKRTRNNPKK